MRIGGREVVENAPDMGGFDTDYMRRLNLNRGLRGNGFISNTSRICSLHSWFEPFNIRESLLKFEGLITPPSRIILRKLGYSHTDVNAKIDIVPFNL
jgi:hypothetical protein